MSGTPSISPEDLLAVCERAAKFHRLQMADRGETAFDLQYSVMAVPERGPIVVQPSGWARVGVVQDLYDLYELRIYWHPTSDRIKVEKPPLRVIEERHSVITSDPLYRTDPTSSKALILPYTAMPGYVYTFEGWDYTADEAERLLAGLTSLDGWTWRRDSG